MKIVNKNWVMNTPLRQLWIHFCDDSLFRNSIYLMLSTGVMAGFGFIFWIIATRLYTPEQIGYATALISTTVLISSFSLLGFNTALIKYLPQAKNPNVVINTAMSAVAITTIAVSTIYLLNLNHLATQFQTLTNELTYAFLFIIFIIMVSLNTLTDSVFIAYRLSKYNLIIYTFFGLVKIISPLFLISYGSYGIFFSYIGSVVISLALSIYFMKKKCGYKVQIVTDKKTAKKMASFSLANYAASFMYGFPTLIMPTIIVGKLGTTQSAHFYMASTIATLLYVIPQATTQSLFAEGSHNKRDFVALVKNTFRLIGLMIIPAIIILLFFGNFILLIFGKEYSINSYQPLQIMSISGIFLAINLVGSTILKLQYRLKELLSINAGYLIITLTLTFWWMKYGILGICWALFIGQIFMSSEYLFILVYKKLKVSSIMKLFHYKGSTSVLL